MNLFASSGAFTFLASLLFGLFSWIKGKRFLNKIWAVFNFSVALWGLGAYKFASTLDKEEVFFWLRIGHLGVILIPVFFLHFVFEFLNLEKKKLLYLVYGVGGFFYILNITDWLGITDVFIVSLRYVFDSFYVDSPPGLFYPAFVAFFFIAALYGHICGIRHYFAASGQKKEQIKYFLFATALGFGGGGTAFFMVFGIDIYPYYHFALPLYPIIMTFAIIRYQLMDIRIIAARTVLFTAVYVPVLMFPFFLAVYLHGTFKQLLGEFWFVVPLIAATILAPGGLYVYQYFKDKAEKILRGNKEVFVQTMEEFLEKIKAVNTLSDLVELVLNKISNLTGVEHVSLYLFNDRAEQFELAGRRGNNERVAKRNIIKGNNQLVAFINRREDLAVREEVVFEIEAKGNAEVKEVSQEMHRLGAEVVIPCFYMGALLAFIVLGEVSDYDTFYDEEGRRVLLLLGTSVGLALQNALFVKDLNTMHSDLLASERLAAIGRLATSAKHEISNPLNIVYGSFQKAMMDIKDRQKGHKRAVEYLTSVRDKTGKLLAELSPGKGVTVIDVIAVYDRVLNALQRMEDNPTLEQCKGEQIDVLNAITQFIERMHSLTVANEKEQEIKTELIHTTEVAHKHIAKVIEFDELLYETIEKGFRGAGRISQAVNAIYHLPKELEQEAAAVNVKELIKESMAFTGFQSYWENLAETGIEIKIPETLPDVQGYFNRLVSVFSNIFLNAYQAMTGAELTSTEERHIRIVAQIPEDDSDMVEIRVANKGPLIAKEELEKIFRHGYSTKEGNKGLGLDIAKTQVEVFHNGTISVRNLDDFGPEFVVRLPVWEGESEE